MKNYILILMAVLVVACANVEDDGHWT